MNVVPAKSPNALLHGTLDALILKTLTGGPRHGYAIAKFIEDASAETVIVEEGSLYPALYRMERRGWLEAEWGDVRARPASQALSAHERGSRAAGGRDRGLASVRGRRLEDPAGA